MLRGQAVQQQVCRRGCTSRGYTALLQDRYPSKLRWGRCLPAARANCSPTGYSLYISAVDSVQQQAGDVLEEALLTERVPYYGVRMQHIRKLVS